MPANRRLDILNPDRDERRRTFRGEHPPDTMPFLRQNSAFGSLPSWSRLWMRSGSGGPR